MEYRDRTEAGRWLALKLTAYAGLPEVVVIALQGGGVPIANEVARSLRVPADILVVRKLRLPDQPDVTIGAITSGDTRVLDQAVLQRLNLSDKALEELIAREKVELALKEKKLRDDRMFPRLEGKTVILVDDGINTGSSMRVAIEALRQQNPALIVMAVPVAPPTVYHDFTPLVDEIVCLMSPKGFKAVRNYYLEFHEITDEEIHRLLEWAADRVALT